MSVRFDKKVVCNDDIVALRLLKKNDELKVGSIYLTPSAYSNNRLAEYEVVSLGKKAADEYGLKPGDKVAADRLAAFFDSEPIVLMKYNNVIAFLNEPGSREKYRPLKNMLFITRDKASSENVGGILVKDSELSMKTGTVSQVNLEPEKNSCRVKVGDRVILTKGGDVIGYAGESREDTVYIYKPEMIVAKVI